MYWLRFRDAEGIKRDRQFLTEESRQAFIAKSGNQIYVITLTDPLPSLKASR